DGQLGIVCAPTIAADGKTRCMPVSTTAYVAPAQYFDDSTCTNPAAMAMGNAGCDPGQFAYSNAATTTCGVMVSSWYRIGAKLAKGYSKSGPDCIPWGDPSADFYEVEPVDSSAFAELTQQ